MPRIARSEKPQYAKVEDYLSELVEEVALLLDSAKTARFREQLSLYNKAWTAWTTYEEAKREKRWKPAMGKPECPLKFFHRKFRIHYDPDKEAKILPGFYSLIAFIHDSQLPHLDKINNVIESSKIIEETLSAPESMIGGRNIGQIYLIEECFNCVRIDLTEYFREGAESEEKGQDHRPEMLSDIELFDWLAKEFEKRSRKVLESNETWLDLNRALEGRFALAVQRLQQAGAAEAAISEWLYKNLLTFARRMTIKSFRGCPDSDIVGNAHKYARELTETFKDLAQKAQESSTPEQPTEIVQENEPELTDTENNTIKALRKDTLIGEKLAKKAGYPYNSNFKSTLSTLRKRGILGNKAPGYLLKPKYHFLLDKSD